MTTPQAKSGTTMQQWEPYPHLEKEEKDMQQGVPEEDLRVKLRSALTPGYHYPHHPDILIGTEIPIYYGDRDPVTRRFPNVRPDILIALNVDAAAIWRRVGYDPIQNGKPPDVAVEIASPSTYRNDMVRKRDIYQMLRVPEYWRFDPHGRRDIRTGDHRRSAQGRAVPTAAPAALRRRRCRLHQPAAEPELPLPGERAFHHPQPGDRAGIRTSGAAGRAS